MTLSLLDWIPPKSICALYTLIYVHYYSEIVQGNNFCYGVTIASIYSITPLILVIQNITLLKLSFMIEPSGPNWRALMLPDGQVKTVDVSGTCTKSKNRQIQLVIDKFISVPWQLKSIGTWVAIFCKSLSQKSSIACDTKSTASIWASMFASRRLSVMVLSKGKITLMTYIYLWNTQWRISHPLAQITLMIIACLWNRQYREQNYYFERLKLHTCQIGLFGNQMCHLSLDVFNDWMVLQCINGQIRKLPLFYPWVCTVDETLCSYKIRKKVCTGWSAIVRLSIFITSYSAVRP